MKTAKSFDIEPKTEDETKSLAGVNSLRPQGRKSLGQMALDAADKGLPGFKSRFLRKKGIIEIDSKPERGSDKSSS